MNNMYIEKLASAIENGCDEIHVLVNMEGCYGEYGPNLEAVDINWDKMELLMEDSFSETHIRLGNLVDVDIDEEWAEETYSFDNGVSITISTELK